MMFGQSSHVMLIASKRQRCCLGINLASIEIAMLVQLSANRQLLKTAGWPSLPLVRLTRASTFPAWLA